MLNSNTFHVLKHWGVSALTISRERHRRNFSWWQLTNHRKNSQVASHYLCATSINVAFLVFVGRKWRVDPMLREHRDNIRVRVEDDRGEGWICSFPGYNQDRLSRTTFVSFVRQTQGLGLINQKLNSWVIVGIRLYRWDPDIVSEHFGCGILPGHCLDRSGWSREQSGLSTTNTCLSK